MKTIKCLNGCGASIEVIKTVPRKLCAECLSTRKKLTDAAWLSKKDNDGRCCRCNRKRIIGLTKCKVCRKKDNKRNRDIYISKTNGQKKTTCSECGTLGHNIRTCPKNPDRLK